MKKILFTDSAPKAVGPYSQAIASGDVVFFSGQLGIDMETGKLAQNVETQAHCAMKNLGAVLKAAGLDYDDIVKTTIFLTDMADFSVVNAVYAGYFASNYPARSCIQISALPLGGLVEIECVAAR